MKNWGVVANIGLIVLNQFIFIIGIVGLVIVIINLITLLLLEDAG